MPNINEFIENSSEQVYKAELQKIYGKKPCAKCEEDVDFYYWDAVQLVMSWKCSKGHENSFKVN
jgi:hypothetical protein